ncbi:succinic semialdehyde dehydrogenase [Agromyces aerolatus]|uniref:succinic semialdehyde dehydrogenase n=1 Tax=Agromyces sp. LY-1074 TaxID=3074080 RepID=UPI0028639CFC|nr:MULTISPECIES: succinic semialdehyde dehydrogenase [unclassified Agromyces]MDR5698918.1 succinic semialdehyde dehydrogenase [Agromyces sp. LY-1074]MDR5705304.1 succinic semialdehyde dehydrogenase [Agromyces sp. LY-1358]
MRAQTASPDLCASLADDVVASGSETIAVPSPRTGEPHHDLPRSSAGDVRDAVARARLAQVAWARAGFAHRRRVLLRAHDQLLERVDLLLDLIQIESGKTRGQALEEVYQAASVTRYNALEAHRVLSGRRARSGLPLLVSTRVKFRPKGVAGVITPWNYALSLAAMDVVPALAAGCAVVQKADDQGALSMLALRRAFIDAGVPESLWAVVAGEASEVGEAVTDEVDFVCFTGSTATGRRIAEKAGRRLVGASLELGGKNAMLVLDDVDPEQAAADAAYACFAAMGQLCVSIERIYVHRRIAGPFIAALVDRLGSARIGTALDYSTDYGSLASAAQLERVRAHLDDALEHGATVLVGGDPRPEAGPWAFAPTVLTGVTPAMRVFGEETFGAIASLYIVDSDEEAVLAANASEYGLNASVLTRSPSRARRIADALAAGSVNIGEGYRGSFASVAAPMGGIKASGLGRRNGPEGLRRFVDPVTVSRVTGVMQLPRTGQEFQALAGPFLLLARVLRAIRRA